MTEGMRRERVASSTVRPKTWRKRLPTALVVLGSVAAVGAALTAAVTPVPGLDFLPSGHWVLNTVTKYAVHIDGGSSNVDAQVSVPGAVGADSQVVQGPETGYVITDGRISVFGKSKLQVDSQVVPPSRETPIAIEAAGGPYAFYPEAGSLVRFGDQPEQIDTGGPFADQVITPDGTVWLYHKDNGNLCALDKGAATVGSCPATVGEGQSGSLTVVGNQVEFLNTTADVLYPLSDKGLGDGQGVGFPVSDNARLASSDVDGRVAILDPDAHKMSLVDAAQPSRDPVTIHLADGGDYAAPASTGTVVALVDKRKGTVDTWDGKGQPQGKGALHDGADARVSKGEDNRIYVENGKGTEVVVVNQNGELSDVPAEVTPDAAPNSEKAKPGPKVTPDPGTTPPPDRDERSASPPDNPQNVPARVPPHSENPGTTNTPVKPDPPVVPASPPGAPSNVRATAGAGSATVNWAAADGNGANVTGYRVTWSGGSKTVSGTAGSTTVTGLTNGTRYTISVAAVNSAGRGPTASAAVTPSAGAAAPTQIDFVIDPATGDGKLTWKQPDLGGGTLLSYKVTATGFQAQSPTGANAPFPGVVPGQSYTFTVRAVTKTPDGRQLTGAAASKTFTVPGPTPKVSVTEGGQCDPEYDREGCHKMQVTMTGFKPNTTYYITPYATSDGYKNEGVDKQTGADGSITFDRFDYYAVGYDVWVVVTDTNGNEVAKSARHTWES